MSAPHDLARWVAEQNLTRDAERLAADLRAREAERAEARAKAKARAKTQDAIRGISRKPVRLCGLVAVSRAYDGGVSINRRGDQGAFYGNVGTCGSTHECFHCSNVKRSERREELEAFGRAVARLYPDGRVGMLTQTIRHRRDDDAKRLVDGLYRAASRLRKQRVWAKFRAAGGIYIQAFEMTYGYRHGWHPHNHVMLVIPTDDAYLTSDEWAAWLADEWAACVAAELGEEHTPTEAHGVRLDWTTTQDAATVAGYCSKLAHEMTDSGTKKARGFGSRTPWQIGEDYARSFYALKGIEAELRRAKRKGLDTTQIDLRWGRVEGRRARDEARWLEYRRAVYRKRLHTGPEALALARAAHAGEVFKQREAEYDKRDGGAEELVRVAVIPEKVWGPLRYYKQARISMLAAAENGGLDAVIREAQRLPRFVVRGRLKWDTVQDATGEWVHCAVRTPDMHYDPTEAAEAIREASEQEWGPPEDEPTNPDDFRDD